MCYFSVNAANSHKVKKKTNKTHAKLFVLVFKSNNLFVHMVVCLLVFFSLICVKVARFSRFSQQ